MKTKHLLFAVVGAGLLATSSCTKTKGEITMTYSKASAVYADLDEIRNMPLVASARSINDPGKIYIGDKFLLIGEKEEGIHVFDNTNPNNPVAISFLQLPMTREFYVDGNFIYAEGHYDFMKINMADMYNPTLVSRVEYAFGESRQNDQGQDIIGFNYETVTETFELGSPEAEALENDTRLYYDYQENLIPVATVPSSFVGAGGDVKGTLNKITTLNNYAYVVGDNEVYVFSDNGNSMAYVNRIYTNASDVETIYPYDNYLYLGTQSSMELYSTTDPSSPSHVSEYWHPTSCDPVLPTGDVAYLTLRSADNSGCAGDENTLDVLDMTDVFEPQPLNTVVMDSPYGIGLDGDYLWIGEGNNGLTLLNNADPTNPTIIKTFTGVQAYDVIPNPYQANAIYVTGDNGMELYEVDYNTLTITPVTAINY
ncbi:LVIVD repeat-containing protein [Parvicella tangerina]|uniref:LVIVD repeat-containing protein n=1 Tax=Parvicella tangerina TaxID=2829795 RepID=A0A916JNF4_9FLAO|nr:hypothetical protein [Parvicella tangerina]CAG5081999.1 hypothetical protein CRYO30217_01782 [Parvicella tangerina]